MIPPGKTHRITIVVGVRRTRRPRSAARKRPRASPAPARARTGPARRGGYDPLVIPLAERSGSSCAASERSTASRSSAGRAHRGPPHGLAEAGVPPSLAAGSVAVERLELGHRALEPGRHLKLAEQRKR